VNVTVTINKSEFRIRSSSLDSLLQTILPSLTFLAKFSLQDTAYQSVPVDKKVKACVFNVLCLPCLTAGIKPLHLEVIIGFIYRVTQGFNLISDTLMFPFNAEFFEFM
jgi:hypothetical protein